MSDAASAASPDDAGEATRLGAIGRAFQHRNYRLFFAGQLVSLIGTWTQSTAQMWLVYRLTGSSLLLGTVAFCQQAPVFFLATAGGAIADRAPKRAVLVATQTVAMLLAFVLAALTLSGRVTVAHVMALATGLGLVNAVDVPTRQSFVVEMVGRRHLMNAVALNSSMVNGARIVGPALAGFAIKAFGEGWCFLGNGVSFVAVIAGLLAMRGLPAPRPREKTGESAFRRVTGGFRFVGTTPSVRAILGLFGLTALAGIPYTTLMPIFASRVYHGDARTLGLLMGATGVGAVIGGIALASRRDDVRGTFMWIAAACGVFGTGLLLFSASTSFWLSLVVLLPLGGGMMVQISATNTLVQTLTPDALRGRVIAVWAMIFMGFAPFGALLAGWLAEAVGPRATLAMGGSVCLAGAAAFAAWARRGAVDHTGATPRPEK